MKFTIVGEVVIPLTRDSVDYTPIKDAFHKGYLPKVLDCIQKKIVYLYQQQMNCYYEGYESDSWVVKIIRQFRMLHEKQYLAVEAKLLAIRAKDVVLSAGDGDA